MNNSNKSYSKEYISELIDNLELFLTLETRNLCHKMIVKFLSKYNIEPLLSDSYMYILFDNKITTIYFNYLLHSYSSLIISHSQYRTCYFHFKDITHVSFSNRSILEDRIKYLKEYKLKVTNYN